MIAIEHLSLSIISIRPLGEELKERVKLRYFLDIPKEEGVPGITIDKYIKKV